MTANIPDTRGLVEELLECPFCGGGNTDRIEQDNREFVLIGCLDCWTQGPSKVTEAEAIEAWNTRASSPRSPGDTGLVGELERGSDAAFVDAYFDPDCWEIEGGIQGRFLSRDELICFAGYALRSPLPSEGGGDG